MDEKAFLRELSRASGELTSNIGDIRSGVWKRIQQGEAAGNVRVLDFADRRWITRLDFAAAAAIVAGAGALYGLATSFWSDMYWSGSFYMFNQYFQ